MRPRRHRYIEPHYNHACLYCILILIIFIYVTPIILVAVMLFAVVRLLFYSKQLEGQVLSEKVKNSKGQNHDVAFPGLVLCYFIV